MWAFTEQNWQDEIKKSLKEGISLDFKKEIFNGQSISPFSLFKNTLCDSQALTTKNKSFITIQNYSDLKSSGLEEWLKEPDVGFRFRELSDLKENFNNTRNFTAFLSQPFPFALSEDQKIFLDEYTGLNNSVNLGWSPLSFGLTRGEILKKPFNGWEKIFSDQSLEHKNIGWFYLSSAPYEWAGAEPQMELAIMLSLGHAIIAELAAIGVKPELAFDKICFGLSLGTDVLVESSKIVAMKLLWQRFREMSEVAGETADVYALPSLRSFSGRDPWNNIMRMTLMSFSALIGGARGFKCIPYDVLNKRKTADAVRVSTNIPLVLKKEGYLNQVINPLDGASLFSDSIDVLCKSAWTTFQEIERKGGVLEAVRSGWLQTELKRSAEYSKNQMSYLQKELVGVNKFISKDPSYGSEGDIIRLSDIIDPLFLSQSADDFLPVEPLLVSSLSYDWEALQMASDQYTLKTKVRPKVTVIKGGGPVVEKKISWLASVLNLGGVDLEIIPAENLEKVGPWSSLAILTTSGDEMEQAALVALKAKGVEKVWSFGHFKKETSIERFLETNINALEFVKDIHHISLENR